MDQMGDAETLPLVTMRALATKKKNSISILIDHYLRSCGVRAAWSGFSACFNRFSSTKGSSATPCQAYFLPFRSILKSSG